MERLNMNSTVKVKLNDKMRYIKLWITVIQAVA